MGQRRQNTRSLRNRLSDAVRAPFAEVLEPRYLMSISALPADAQLSAGALPWSQSITPAQARVAAGLTAQAGEDGAGQTIAIVAPFKDATIGSDLKQFDKQFQLPDAPSFSVINATGATSIPSADQTWSAEIALDVEWAHAIAPTAKIVLVQAASDHADDLATAVDTARNLPGVSVVSMSWGVDAFDGSSAFNGIFTTPASHGGVTFVAAGSDVASTAVAGTTTDPWPASVATVMPVEANTWPGLSTILGSFVQSSIDFKPPQSLSGTGYAVYNSGGGGWQSIGGTSALTPRWAGLIAVANQDRASAGFSSLDGAASSLPSMFRATNTVTAVGDGTTGLDPGDGTAPASPPADQPVAENPPAPTKKPKPSRSRPSAPIARAAAVIYAQGRIAAVTPPSIGFNFSAKPLEVTPSRALPAAQVSTLIKGAGHSDLPIAAPLKVIARAPKMRLAATDLAAALADIPFAISQTLESASNGVTFFVAAMPDSIPLLRPIAAATIRATFADTLAVFIDESVSGRPQGTPVSRSHSRAWLITATAIVADGVLLRTLLLRKKKPKQRNIAQRIDEL